MSIHVVHNVPLPPSEDIPANIAEALISLEEFLGIPFPQDFVVALMPVVGPAAEVEVHYSNLNAGWRMWEGHMAAGTFWFSGQETHL